MCFDIKTSLEKQLRQALLDGHKPTATEIVAKLSKYSKEEVNIHHASGFDHPSIFIHTDTNEIELAQWGFIPEWINGDIDQLKFSNKTLNARSETMFEKTAFEPSARGSRCIIYLEGFFEHHHRYGKVYPYFIRHQSKDLMPVAGLYLATDTKKTFSIVTTKANSLLQDIHNNPKLNEPRMPLILNEKSAKLWLNKNLTEDEVKGLVTSYPSDKLKAHTVGAIRGQAKTGNTKQSIQPVTYAELEISQTNLF